MAAVRPLKSRAQRAWRTVPLLAAALAGAGCTRSADPALFARAGDPARGEVVFALAGGCGCHTMKEGPVGAGGQEIPTPFGTFYSTNITPDPGTGIGDWSDEEIEGAIRRGVLRDGSVESPVMPYYRYAGMSDADVRDLIAHLRTLPAAVRENRPADVKLPLPRLAFRGWRLLFARDVQAPAVAPASGAERGQYLTDHVSICGDCHTPRDAFGAPDRSLYLAGVADEPPIEFAPNITPDDETGIGKWDASDISGLLESGFKPDFDNVQGRMAEVIDGVAGGPGYAKAPDADRDAIAAWLKSIPAIHHAVGRTHDHAAGHAIDGGPGS